MRDRPNDKEAWDFIRNWHLDKRDDRTLAIMAATLLEHSLEEAIATHFHVGKDEAESIFIDQSEGSISAFSMKIKLAYALGVMENKVKKELTLIKNIRNVFAHSPINARFSTQKIADACEHLFICKEVQFGGLLGPAPQTAKHKYAKSIELLYMYLTATIDNKFARIPLLFGKSDLYCIMFLNKETQTKRMAKELIDHSREHGAKK